MKSMPNLRLLNERAGYARHRRIKGTGAVYRPEREVAVLRRIQSLNQVRCPDEVHRKAVSRSDDECWRWNARLTIAYLGPQGTFTSRRPSNISAMPPLPPPF